MRRSDAAGILSVFLAVAGGFASPARAQDPATAPGAGAPALTEQARAALLAGRDNEALTLLQQEVARAPRDAAVHLHLAVALYRLGRPNDARQALAVAAALDANDPRPATFDSIIGADLVDPAASIAAARIAERLPRDLEVLTKIASDTEGAANLGYGYALRGQDERAEHVAQETFAPLWSGSHLFVRRLYTGAFGRRSALLQGLLADPLAIGASTRFHTLLPRSATYVTAGVRASSDRSDERTVAVAPHATLNGQRTGALPMSFLFDVTREHGFGGGDGRDNLRRRVPSTTFAFGLAPARGSFLVVIARERLDDRYRDESTDARLDLDFSHHEVDVGLQYRFTPRSALSLKVGTSGTSGASAPARPSAGPASGAGASQLADDLSVQQLQVRETITFPGGAALGVGAESSTRRRDTMVSMNDASSRVELVTDAETFDVDARMVVGDAWVLEGRVGVTRTTDGVRATRGADVVDRLSEASAVRMIERGAIVRRLGAGRLVRLVHEHWLLSPSESSLAPVATGGLPPDERLVGYNGEARDTRVQVEWTSSPSTFTTMFAAYRRIDNPESWVSFAPLQPPAGTQWALSRLEQRWLLTDADDRQAQALSLARAIVRTGGISVNHLITTAWAARARYEFTSSDASSPLTTAAAALAAPYIPRHRLVLGATWVAPEWRVLAGGELAYRSERHVAFGNLHTIRPLAGDWVMHLRGRWELPNKEWALEVGGRELFAARSPFSQARFTADVSVRY